MQAGNGEVWVNVKDAFPDADDVELKFTVAVYESRGLPTPVIDTTKPALETLGGLV